MAAEGRNEGLCDLSNVVAFGHNKHEGATRSAKNPPNGNTAGEKDAQTTVLLTVDRSDIVNGDPLRKLPLQR